MESKQGNKKIFETLDARLRELNGVETAVGWFENARYENGTPVAYVAAIQELGKHARPFLRPTINEKSGDWAVLMGRGARAVLDHGESPESVLDKVGFQVEGDISKTISEIYAPPLSPITILLRYWRRQGRKITGRTVGEAARAIAQPGYVQPAVSDKPLVDSGILLDTLTHQVRKSA